uniref:Axin-2 n=1 Tax=Cacopsylla melanoneura TaxID=428564 RepID=A0A8D8R1P9_9HEMI
MDMLDSATFDKGTGHSQQQQRPPVHPGRDNATTTGSSAASSIVDGGGTTDQPPPPPLLTSQHHSSSSCSARSVASVASDQSTPPLPLPRRSNLTRAGSADGFAPLGFEPEGGSDGGGSPSPGGGGEALSSSPPNYLEWAKSFNNLLNDPEGLHLFRKYLSAENQSDLLEFWFACEGLKKQTSQDQINLIVKCIYRRYFKDSRLGLSESCLGSVLESIRASSRTPQPVQLSSRIFAESQQEVERIINTIVYRNFLQSDIYLNYIHHMTQDSCSGSTTGSTSSSGAGGGGSHCPSHASSTHTHNQSSSLPPPSSSDSRINRSNVTHELNMASSGGTSMGHDRNVSSSSGTNMAHERNMASSSSHYAHERNMSGSSNMPHDRTMSQSMSMGDGRDVGSVACLLMSKSLPNASSMMLGAPTLPATSSQSVHHHHSSVPPAEDIVSSTLNSLTEDLTSSLPTLHEDSEADEFFDFRNKPLPPGPGPPKLTRDSLLATARKRTMTSRPKPETFAGNRPNKHHGGGHGNSSSNPRSSDHSAVKPPRSIMNREENLHNTIIPRTVLKGKVTNMKPKDFAEVLISKLTAVKRDRDTDERLLRSLNEGPMGDPSSGLSSALTERFPNSMEDDQDILDQHIESVFDKIGLSPGFTTPSRPKSPEAGGLPGAGLPPRLPPKVGGAASMGPPLPPPPPHHQVPMSRLDYLKHKASHYHHHHHRDRDGTFSIFTSDSGNVQDMTDGTETLLSYGNSSSGYYGNGSGGNNGGNAGNGLPKSKSMPDYSASFGDPSLGSCSRQGSRRYGGGGIGKRSDSQIFDSGISGISCSTNTAPAPPNPALALAHNEQAEYFKNKNVTQWLMESSASSSGTTENKTSSSTCTRLRHTTTVKHKSGSRSCSSERPGGALGTAGGAGGSTSGGASVKMHPYVVDPSMPPLNPPHTITQLEEVSRRLLERDSRPIQSRFKTPPTGTGASKPLLAGADPSLSTLRSTASTPLPQPGYQPRPSDQPAAATSSCFTTVVFTFCDEQYPYRTKIPTSSVTLKQFKDYLPKKGSFRFFFKTECDDVDTKVIQEEIVDDNEILPLWEGKVMGQVKNQS